MVLFDDARLFLEQGGVDLFGVAGFESFAEAEPGHRPQDILPAAKSVLVYAVRLFDFPRLAQLNSENIPLGIHEYTANFFIAANLLDQLSYRLARSLHDQGHASIPIPAGPPYDGVRLRGFISHKYAAEMAGIGQRGLCDLLLTKRFGPRVRLASLITEAELTASQPLSGSLCKDFRNKCQLACVKACPVGAISLENGLDKWRCDRYNEIILSKGPIKIRCGRCVAACPIGRSE